MTKTKLQIMREKKGLTVEQLAENISELTGGVKNVDYIIFVLYKYETGKTKLKHGMANNNLEITAQALDCSVEELREE